MPAVIALKDGRMVRDGAEELTLEWTLDAPGMLVREVEAKVTVDFWVECSEPAWAVTSIQPEDAEMPELYDGMTDGLRRQLFEHLCSRLNLDPAFIEKVREKHEAQS